LWWFFNFVVSACSVVAVVLHGSVGDVYCCRGVEKKTTRWLMVLHLVEVPMAILMSVYFSVVVCCQVVYQVLDALWVWCPDDFLVVDFG
jgi:hypothetical protein